MLFATLIVMYCSSVAKWCDVFRTLTREAHITCEANITPEGHITLRASGTHRWKKTNSQVSWSFFWQRNQDLNPDEQSQSLLCYRYTIPLWFNALTFYHMKICLSRGFRNFFGMSKKSEPWGRFYFENSLVLRLWDNSVVKPWFFPKNIWYIVICNLTIPVSGDKDKWQIPQQSIATPILSFREWCPFCFL